MIEGMDEIDTAWLTSALPPDAIPQGFISVVAWFDPEGAQHWKVVQLLDADLSGCLGLLELAKFDLISRTDGMWFGAPDE